MHIAYYDNIIISVVLFIYVVHIHIIFLHPLIFYVARILFIFYYLHNFYC